MIPQWEITFNNIKMKLFSKLFKQTVKNEPIKQNNLGFQQNLTPRKTEEELLERFGAIAFENQLNFGEVIGENNWNVDLTKGEISFGQNLTFPIQVLGTVSHSSQTWLWAWANTKSGVPESLLQDALNLKNYGEVNEIDILRNDTFDFLKDDLHKIGLIASGINSCVYYIADYGKGAMLVTIKREKIDKLKNEDNIKILTVFPRLISEFEINHKNALAHYLTANGYSIAVEENKVTGTKNGNNIVGYFDELSRLIELNGNA